MTLGKLILKKNKAVSPVIATILLIALTVTAAAIVYFVVVPLLTNKPQLAYTGASFVLGTDDQFEITLENIGSEALTISAVAVQFGANGSDVGAPVVQGFTDVVLAGSTSQKVTLTVAPDFVDGVSYKFIFTYTGGKTIEVTATK